MHYHVCQYCTHFWSHSEDGDISEKENAARHRCPRCGSGPYFERFDTKRAALREKEEWRPDYLALIGPPLPFTPAPETVS